MKSRRRKLRIMLQCVDKDTQSEALAEIKEVNIEQEVNDKGS